MVAERLREAARALRGSVRVRTTSAAVAVLAVALLVGAIALVGSLHAVLIREMRATVSLRAADAARELQAGGDPATAVAGDDDVVLQVVDGSGAVLAATPNAAGEPALLRLAPGEFREVEVPFDDDAFLVTAADAGTSGDAGGQTVLVGNSLDAVSESTRTLTLLLALGLPALLAVVGATTWRVVGRALAPVDAIRAEVDAISAASLDRRVPAPAAGDEIGRLAETMNRMLDRLERARLRERRFVADASHELRSPIAAIRQHAEVALEHPAHADGLARTARAESLRMEALVDDLLLLAHADEHTLALRRRPVDLDDLVLDEVRRLRVGAALTVDARAVSAARVNGDPATLRRMLRNLGDNATRHARGRVALALAER
ncbi:MAG TPA: HAMP domain-containing sensor histidine kinase, partial [Asanoa sp.]|nr:HAMP domain-containing sensor histidine kinase [Asanoa sp.]